MNIWWVLILFAIFVATVPFHSYFVSQYILNAPKRTRRKLMKYYTLCKQQYPEAPEEELLRYAMHGCFVVSNKEPDAQKPEHYLTKRELDEMIEIAGDIEQLINIVIERDFSPDVTLCGL